MLSQYGTEESINLFITGVPNPRALELESSLDILEESILKRLCFGITDNIWCANSDETIKAISEELLMLLYLELSHLNFSVKNNLKTIKINHVINY